jgi:hypothetical protein
MLFTFGGQDNDNCLRNLPCLLVFRWLLIIEKQMI